MNVFFTIYRKIIGLKKRKIKHSEGYIMTFSKFLKGSKMVLSKYAQEQENITGEVYLYLPCDRAATRKRNGYVQWLTYIPSYRKEYRVTKVKVNLDEFTCYKTVTNGHYIVQVPPQIHKRLVNKSVVRVNENYRPRKTKSVG